MELRMRLTRIFSKILVLIMVGVMGFLLLPYLNEVILVIPYLGLPLVSLGAVSCLRSSGSSSTGSLATSLPSTPPPQRG